MLPEDLITKIVLRTVTEDDFYKAAKLFHEIWEIICSDTNRSIIKSFGLQVNDGGIDGNSITIRKPNTIGKWIVIYYTKHHEFSVSIN